MIRIVLFFLVGVFYNINFSFSQGGGISNTTQGGKIINTVSTAVPFLRIAPDARAGAMGDMGVALSADPNALFWNPSKLPFAEKNSGVSVSYTPWLRNLGINDIYLAYLSGYYKLDKMQAVGGSLRFFSLGEIVFTDINAQETGRFKPNEFALDGSYARKLSDYFSTAVTLRFIYSNLAAGQVVDGQDIRPGITGAADISFYYQNPKIKLGDYKSNFAFGVNMSNVGAKIAYTNQSVKDFIPTNLGIGAGLTVELDEYNQITFALDLNKLLVPTPDTAFGQRFAHKDKSVVEGIMSSFSDAPGGIGEEFRELTWSPGIEYWYDQQFAVRGGFFYEHATKGNRKFATIGFGLRYNIFELHFSYLVPTSNQRNPLDNTMRFSLLFNFDAFSSNNE